LPDDALRIVARGTDKEGKAAETVSKRGCRNADYFLILCQEPDRNSPSQGALSVMDYKSIEYHVLQTANPTGWSWTVKMEGREPRTGSAHNRTAAIALAQIAIDKLLKAHPPANSDGATIVARTSAIEKPDAGNGRDGA